MMHSKIYDFRFPKLTMFLGTLGNVNWCTSTKQNKTKQKTLFSDHIHLGKDIYCAPLLRVTRDINCLKLLILKSQSTETSNCSPSLFLESFPNTPINILA